MSTSSPISRYHEVYVHQVPRSAEIQVQEEPQCPRPPSYQESLIELDEGVTSRMMSESASINENATTTSNPEDRTGAGGGGIAAPLSIECDRLDPPTYDEAIDPASAPPPSYDSLFGRVREARKSSKGLMDFAKNVLILLLGTLGCTIILCVTIVIPVCMIVFGMLYMYDCPSGEYIPVYLLVGGGFGVLKQLMHLSTRVRSREDQAAERLRQSPTQQLINCFMFGWFIIGSFWIFKEYEPNYDPSKGKYCNKSLYMFAFWLIMSVYISLGVITVGLCAIALGSIITHRRSSNHTSL